MSMSGPDSPSDGNVETQPSSSTRHDRLDSPDPDGLPDASPTTNILSRHIPLSDLAAVPTLFPTPIANIVTALATSARFSLRVAAFFVEAILESSQYSTRMSLGYTRRLLISAISSARRFYLMSHAALDGDMMGIMGFGNDKSFLPSTDAFLQVLDKYTNLGIYVIHHSFTMAELFAMSGFYLTANAVQSAHFAAQESVALFDSLFGSNESSRALSAIITLVRRELLEDERFKAADKGKVTSLTALTKALTAFACLQTATWRQTSDRMRMRVLYDCTVVAERDELFKSNTKVTVHDNLAIDELHHPALEDSEEKAGAGGPGPSSAAHRERHSDRPPLDEINGRLWAHLRDPASSRSTRRFAPHPREDSDMDIDDLWELDDLVGESGDEEYDGPPDELARRRKRLKRMRDDEVEITDELTESTIITQMLARVHEDGRPVSKHWQTRQPKPPLPDVAVEEMDDEEPQIRVGTTVEAPSRQSSSPRLSASDENEWIEVDHLLGDEEVREDAGGEYPSAPNGDTSVATMSYRDALEHPAANAERFQLVVKTMTNKLLQRKRTVRRVRTAKLSDSSSREETMGGSRSDTPLTVRRSDVKRIGWGRGSEWQTEEASTPQSAKMTSSSSAPLDSAQTTTANFFGTNGKSRLFPLKRTGTTSSANDRGRLASKKDSTVSRAMAKARSAFRRRSPPLPTDSQSSTASSSPTPSARPRSPRPSSPRLRTSRQADTDSPNPLSDNPLPPRAPPPTPYASTVLRKTDSNEARTSPNTQRRARRPSMTAVHESIRTSQSRVHAASSQVLPDTPALLFPHHSLIKNIHRFMRYSSAAYGQNFLRIFGLGNCHYNFPSTVRHHANSWAFAQHTNIPIDCLLLSSYTESTPGIRQKKAPPLIHYIAVEHNLQAIVLTCRGTLGLSDVLIDLTCDYQSIEVDGGSPDADYYVHSGMYQSALGLTAKNSTVHKTLSDALTRYPGYGLVLCGHSLGGGVAALLAIVSSTDTDTFLKQNAAQSKPVTHPPISTAFVTSFGCGLPAGRPIHAYAYGPPAITSPDLARYTEGLITSVVQNSDVVPCLSLGVLRDLKNVAVTLFEEGNVAEEIVGRVVGIYQRKFSFQQARQPAPPRDTAMDVAVSAAEYASGSTHNLATDREYHEPRRGFHGLVEPSDEEVLADWMTSLIKTMRADMDNEKLYPPGMVYIIEYSDVFVTVDPRQESSMGSSKAVSHKQAHRVILRHCDSVEERFREPLFTKTMLNDHLPSHYERATQLLYDGLGRGKI